MKNLKVGEADKSISIQDAFKLHGNNCKVPYIIEKPNCRIEQQNFFSLKFFSQKSWVCLNCNWESEVIRTRTA